MDLEKKAEAITLFVKVPNIVNHKKVQVNCNDLIPIIGVKALNLSHNQSENILKQFSFYRNGNILNPQLTVDKAGLGNFGFV